MPCGSAVPGMFKFKDVHFKFQAPTTRLSNGSKVKAQIWDTAGQERPGIGQSFGRAAQNMPRIQERMHTVV